MKVALILSLVIKQSRDPVVQWKNELLTCFPFLLDTFIFGYFQPAIIVSCTISLSTYLIHSMQQLTAMHCGVIVKVIVEVLFFLDTRNTSVKKLFHAKGKIFPLRDQKSSAMHILCILAVWCHLKAF